MARRKSKQIREWGVPGRKDSEVYAGGLGSGGLPLIDGVNIDIYLSGLDTSIDGISADNSKYAVEITVEQDADLEPDLRTFNDEEEAILYARKYADFLMKVLNNT